MRRAGDEAESGNVASGSEPATGKLHPTRASLQHANRRAGGGSRKLKGAYSTSYA